MRVLFACIALCLTFTAVCHGQQESKAPGEQFRTLKIIDVGEAPHQIAFSRDGATAYIAAAGSDQLTLVDTRELIVTGTIPVTGVPLGIAVLEESSLGVSRFQGDGIVRVHLPDGAETKTLQTGRGSSLFSAPLPHNQWLITSEEENQLSVIDGSRFEIVTRYATGERPFPAAATVDGRKAFVPDYAGGSVTIIDLWNASHLTTISVGDMPSGGTVLPGDISYAVALRGEDRIDLINVGTHEITGRIEEGIGDSPFSVVASPDARFAFVNNTGSHDVSVIDLQTLLVINRLPVGEIPIVIAVHPDGGTLWVACEGSHELHVLTIPPQTPVAVENAAPPEILVMGMTHDQHLTSTHWGLAEIEAVIRRIDPDVVCAEIPPNRWNQTWLDYTEQGVVTDTRVVRFPEYVNVLLPLKKELGFTIEPCAGWTNEMNLLRSTRISEFENDVRFAQQYIEYQRAEKAAAEKLARVSLDLDDPITIHSAAYDEYTRTELQPYDRYLNDWIGPGGWTNINEAHYALIDQAIGKHAGKRILITFGAGHKYWFLDQLKEREDIRLLDIQPYLTDN